jgi:glucan biosynthesis protein C
VDELSDAFPTDLTRRYHGIDALRGAMMLLGVVLHAAICYLESAGDASWAYRDPRGSPLAAWLLISIHAFRMPAFFVLAGFFAALLWSRRGPGGFVADRVRRILLPLAVGWVVLFPLVRLSFAFGAARLTGATPAEAIGAVAGPVLAAPWRDANPAHLWFLAMLVVLYGLALLATVAIAAVPASVRAAFDRGVGAVLAGRTRVPRVLVLAAATLLTIVPMDSPGIDTPTGFVMPPRIVIAHGFFFLVGWQFFRHRAAMEALADRPWVRLSGGLALLAVTTVATLAWWGAVIGGADRESAGMGVFFIVLQAVTAVTIWLLVLGGIGAAERLLDGPVPGVRFLVDASYWTYLVHLPMVVAAAALLQGWESAPTVRMAGTIVLVSVACLASYAAVRGVLPWSAPVRNAGPRRALGHTP